MFDRLLFWLREKARLLFGENTTVSVSVSYSMENAIVLWAQMYDSGGRGVMVERTPFTVWVCPIALHRSWPV